MVSSANSSYDDELKTNTCKSMSARKKVSTPSKTSYPYYILACVVMLCVGLGITYFFLQNNVASAQEYPIKGFDVSHHQGDIQWQSISPQEFKFVYLKATEGGDFKDRKFQDNWLKAREQGFLVGAYHFYRLCRDGQIQAQNFIETVPKKTDSLPPVIDLEYDSNCINTYTREQLLKEIQVMHDQLYKHYGCNPFFIPLKHFIILFWSMNLNKLPFGFVNIKASLSSKAIRNGLFGNTPAKVKLKAYQPWWISMYFRVQNKIGSAF